MSEYEAEVEVRVSERAGRDVNGVTRKFVIDLQANPRFNRGLIRDAALATALVAVDQLHPEKPGDIDPTLVKLHQPIIDIPASAVVQQFRSTKDSEDEPLLVHMLAERVASTMSLNLTDAADQREHFSFINVVLSELVQALKENGS